MEINLPIITILTNDNDKVLVGKDDDAATVDPPCTTTATLHPADDLTVSMRDVRCQHGDCPPPASLGYRCKTSLEYAIYNKVGTREL